jgi:SnoaL-like domain
MSSNAEFQELRRDIQFLKDRLAVLDCVNNQSRGHDRHDVELMTSVYLEDGVDEHGPNVLSGVDYGEWANQTHSTMFEDHLHNITTHTCEIDGDVAHCESYVFGAMRSPDSNTVTLIGGRYLDRLERSSEGWRIALRRCTIEWTLNGDSSLLQAGAFKGFLKGSWDRDDLSYVRPLRLDSKPAQRW